MQHLEKFKDTLQFQVGEKIFYIGDKQDGPYWSKIIEVKKGTTHSPQSYRLRQTEAPYKTITVPHYCFSVNIGQMFKCINQVKIEREIANNKLHNFLRSCK
jgi:hypothetical protein